MRRAVHLAVFGVTLAAMLAGGWWGWRAWRTGRAAAAAVTYVRGQARLGDIRATVGGSGPVSAANFYTVRANVSGIISEILLDEGQAVRQGQPVLAMVGSDVDAALQNAKLQLDTARVNLEKVLNPDSQSVLNAQYRVQQAELALANRRSDVENLAVTTPWGGSVSALRVKAGDAVSNNQVVATVIDDSELLVEVHVGQALARFVRAGQGAEVSLSGGLITTAGKVSDVLRGSPLAGREPQIPVRIALSPPPDGARPGMAAVATIQVDPAEYQGVVSAAGSVTAPASFDVRARVAGTVARVEVQEGDPVRPGQVVVLLDSEGVRSAHAQAQIDLDSARLSLQALTAPNKEELLQHTIAQLRLSLTQAELTYQQRLQDKENLRVPSTMDGTIAQIFVQPGDRVGPGTNLFRVADYRLLQVVVPVDELDVARVRPGQAATIVVDALPDRRFRGQVMRVAPEGFVRDGITNYNVTVAITGAGQGIEGLRPGMMASVDIAVDQRQGVVWVPAEAVRQSRGQATVRVFRPGVPEPETVNVQVGLTTSSQVEIVAGLREGDEIVLAEVRRSQAGGPLGFAGPGGAQGQKFRAPLQGLRGGAP